MVGAAESRSERYLQFSRRSMTVLLLMILAIGAVCIAMALWPGEPAWGRAAVPLTLIMTVIAVGLQRTLKGDRWDPRQPEVRAIVEDEFRQGNMNRARRVAFAVVLAAQLPLGLLLSGLPTFRALMAMAASSITVGLVTLLALFLYFDRDVADAG